MLFATHPPGVFTARIKPVGKHGVTTKGLGMRAQGLLGHLKDTNALHHAGRAGKVLLDGGRVNANGLKNLGAAVGHVGRDAHFRHNLREPLANGLHIIGNGFFGTQFTLKVFVKVGNGLHGQVGMHGLGAVACKHCEMVNLTGRARFHHQARLGSQALTHQMLMHGRQRQQSGNGNLIGGHGTVT